MPTTSASSGHPTASRCDASTDAGPRQQSCLAGDLPHVRHVLQGSQKRQLTVDRGEIDRGTRPGAAGTELLLHSGPIELPARTARGYIDVCPCPALIAERDLDPGRRAVSYTHLRAHETDSYLVC